MTDSCKNHFIYFLWQTGSRYCDNAILNSYFQRVAAITFQIYKKRVHFRGCLIDFVYINNNYFIQWSQCGSKILNTSQISTWKEVGTSFTTSPTMYFVRRKRETHILKVVKPAFWRNDSLNIFSIPCTQGYKNQIRKIKVSRGEKKAWKNGVERMTTCLNG